MSTLYLVFLSGVAILLLGVLADAVLSVSRKPRWGQPARHLQLVPTVDRRQANLTFVGADRRQGAAPAAAQDERLRA